MSHISKSLGSQVTRKSGARPAAISSMSRGADLLCVAAFLAFLFLVRTASAQLYAGSIAGTVTDPSGAMVASAQVVATDSDKGFTYAGTTDRSGRYVVRS